MKKILATLMLILLIFSGCGAYSFDNGILTFQGNEYTIADIEWNPIGKLLEETHIAYMAYPNKQNSSEQYIEEREVRCFEGDANKVYIMVGEENLFAEPVLYHKKSDIYPIFSSSNINIVEISLTLVVGQEKKLPVELQAELVEPLKTIADGKNNENWNLGQRKNMEEIALINIYYEDYPAFETSLEISYTKSGDVGIAYVSTEKNAIKFGDANMLFILPDDLAQKILAYFEN